ncbi:MAG: DNA repair and recombination protein RadB [Nanoarchaeota archaeon]
MEKLTSNSAVIDKLLNGGYEKDTITTIYGPAGSGKTLLCLLCSIKVSESKKVIYVDTEGGYSIERLKQLTPNFKEVLEKMLFYRPTSFQEQKTAFNKLKSVMDDKVGLIIIDTISMLYRLELGKSDEIYDINRELGLQISYLNEIARKKNIAVLITNQVYADFKNKNNVKMVGGDILKYGSKCLIELKSYKNGIREAILKKHRSINEGKKVLFKIVQNGIEEADKRTL